MSCALSLTLKAKVITMKKTLTIDLVLPSGAKYKATSLPASLAVQDVISQILSVASLPRLTPDGKQLKYDLRWEKEKSLLSQVKGLVDQGVSDGEALRLIVDANPNGTGSRKSEEEPIGPVDPNAKNVKVRIDISNMAGQSVEEVFPYDTKIEDVLKQVHKKHKLHIVSGLNIDYRIVGGHPHRRTLQLQKSLREEEIRQNDKLDVLFEDKAGARHR
jgi:hypothetical protein